LYMCPLFEANPWTVTDAKDRRLAGGCQSR
jgi:hypothetical protein